MMGSDSTSSSRTPFWEFCFSTHRFKLYHLGGTSGRFGICTAFFVINCKSLITRLQRWNGARWCSGLFSANRVGRGSYSRKHTQNLTLSHESPAMITTGLPCTGLETTSSEHGLAYPAGFDLMLMVVH